MGGHASDAAESAALDVARRYGAPVVAVHVMDKEHAALSPDVLLDLQGSMNRTADRLLHRLQEAAERRHIRFTSVILHGQPALQIVRFAKARDLLIVSTHGRRGWRRFLLGSVAEEIVRTAPCPVLVMRGAGA